MRNLVCVLSFLFVYSTCLISQRNAPVAGDAATLVDLLRKDYSVIDQSLLDDEIMKNRSQVISIFKSYLSGNLILNQPDYKKIQDSLKKKQDSFDLAQKIYTTYTTVDLNSKSIEEIREVNKKLNDYTNNLETSKRELYKAKFDKDSFELKELKNNYKDSFNLYLDTIIGSFISKYTSLQNKEIDINAKSNPNASIQKSIPFLGGDVGFEMVIDGLSKFLAKRIKEELTTYVIDEVKRWLKNPGQNDPIAELKVILPRTNEYLLNFNANQVTNFPTQIKQYIEDDFNHIFDNVGNLRNTPRLQRLTEQYPDIDFALEAIEMIPNLSKIKNPVDYFELLENSRNLNRWKTEQSNHIKYNIANTLSLSTMLAHSFTFIENGQPRFVSTDFISTYGSELEFYLLYVGFLRQQNVKYYNDLKFLKESKDPIIIQNALKSIVKKDLSQINADKVLISSTEIKKLNKSGLKIGPDTLYTYINSIIDLAQEVTFSCDTVIKYLDVKLANQKTEIEIKEKISPYFRIASQMNEIVLDFQKKRYSTGLIKTLEITNDFMSSANNWNGEDILKNIRELSLLDQKSLKKRMYANEWNKLNELLTVRQSTETKITSGQKDTLRSLILNLNTAISFYYENFPLVRSQQENIVKLASLANSWVNTGIIPVSEKQSAKEILDSTSFREIILSTYFGYKIADEIDVINTKLKDVKIGDKHVFFKARIR